jgi:IclR family acetate operon transcriptional repressor
MEQKSGAKRARGRPKLQQSDHNVGTVQALDRGLNLMRVLSKEAASTLTDLALQVGMPPSTAHRILATLQSQGFVELDQSTQQWSIGIEAFRVGSAYLGRTNLVEAARATMRELTEQTGETANLAVANQGDVVFISQVESRHPIRAFFQPGTRGFMHASGIGKVLLANLERSEVENILQKKGCPHFTDKTITSPSDLFIDLDNIRERGWSYDDEESHDGMRCVAGPIFNSFGEVVAGVSVSGPSARLSDSVIPEIGPKVKRAAAEITQHIGGRVPELD